MSARNRIWLLVVVVVGLGVVALGYLLGIAPKLEEVKTADAARAEAASTNALYERQLAKLKKDYEGIDDLQEQLDKLNIQLPAETGYDTYLSVVESLASYSGTSVSDFTWGVPTLVTADSAGAIAAAAEADAAGEEDVPVVAPEVTGVAPDGALIGLSWSITVHGKLDALRGFIELIQRTDRQFTVAGYTISASTGQNAPEDEYTLVLSGATWVLMNSTLTDDEEEAPAEEPTPAPTPTETPTPTTSATPKP